jgi:ribosomal protein L20
MKFRYKKESLHINNKKLKMVRVKRGMMTRKRHKSLLKKTKGFRLLNSRVFSRAKNAWMKK